MAVYVEKSLSEAGQTRIIDFISKNQEHLRDPEILKKIAHLAYYPAIRNVLMELPTNAICMATMVDAFPPALPSFTFHEAERFALFLELEKFFHDGRVMNGFVEKAIDEKMRIERALESAFSKIIDFNHKNESVAKDAFDFWGSIGYANVFGIPKTFAQSVFFENTDWDEKQLRAWMDYEKYPYELVEKSLCHRKCTWNMAVDFLKRFPFSDWNIFRSIASRKGYVGVKVLLQFAKGYRNSLDSSPDVNKKFLSVVEKLLEREECGISNKIALLAEAGFEEEIFVRHA